MRKVIFLGRRNSVWSDQAFRIAKGFFHRDQVTGLVGDWGSKPEWPEEADIVLSFLCPWVVPEKVLSRARVALNFHPGSADYPGVGCYNFAIFERAPAYGGVCHHISKKVDTGAIVAETLFAVPADVTVEFLKLRTMVVLLSLFHDIAERVATGAPLPEPPRNWIRRPFTRAELNQLGCTTPDMSAEEVELRVRAMEYPGFPGAFTELQGRRYYLSSPEREPLA